MLLLVGGTALALWRIDHSGLGRTCRAIAMNEDLSQSLGIPVFRYKLMSFVVACFFAGVGGAFSAHYYRCLDPTSFTVTASIIVQIQATVGGAGAIVAGGILGATLITIVDHFLISIDPRLIIFFMGAIILAVTFFLPEGVVSLPRILKNYGLKVGSWFHS
jgi:branched-chain amino acid transport system permease protein